MVPHRCYAKNWRHGALLLHSTEPPIDAATCQCQTFAYRFPFFLCV